MLAALHHFGAPASILVDGKPHLGTDRLIGILRAFRARLLALGVQPRWGAPVHSVDVQSGAAVGVRLAGDAGRFMLHCSCTVPPKQRPDTFPIVLPCY